MWFQILFCQYDLYPKSRIKVFSVFVRCVYNANIDQIQSQNLNAFLKYGVVFTDESSHKKSFIHVKKILTQGSLTSFFQNFEPVLADADVPVSESESECENLSQ